MDQEAPQRANPCTQLKAAFILGLALFAGKTMYDYQATTPDMFNPALASTKPITVGGNTGVTKPVPAIPCKTNEFYETLEAARLDGVIL
jgi:hypothetical protein